MTKKPTKDQIIVGAIPAEVKADLPDDVTQFLEVAKTASPDNPLPANIMEGIFKQRPEIITALREQGIAEVPNSSGKNVVLGAGFNAQGELIYTAAAVPRNPGKSENFLEEVADFSTSTTDRNQLIDLYERIYAREGIINNAINKAAALVAKDGQFKVRYVKGARGVSADAKAEEFRLLLQFWQENLNARSDDGAVKGDRGLTAFIAQGTRMVLKQGDHFGRQNWGKVKVQVLKGKAYSLPMNIQTFDGRNIEIPEGLEGTDLDLFYWKPPTTFIETLRNPRDKNVKVYLDKLVPKDVQGELLKNGKYLLDPALVIHVKHRGTATSNYGECHDDKTEVLTRDRGWVLFKDLTDHDHVATRNSEGVFAWEIPTARVDHEYDGTLWHLHSRSMDMMVTPNHRMLLTGISKDLNLVEGNREVIVTAEEFVKYNTPYVKIPVTSLWVGSEISNKTLVPENSNADTIHLTGDQYVALMACYLSEGNRTSLGGIEINQFQKDESWPLFEALLTPLGATYNKSTNRGRFVLCPQAYGDHVKHFGADSYNKFIPGEIRNASVRQLRIFWDYYVAGDGCVQRQDLSNPQVSITTTSKLMADHLVEIAQKLGMSASVGIRPAGIRNVFGRMCNCVETYTIRCRYSKAMQVSATQVPYQGRVYCVQVPSGVVYTRRNGYPAWSGNSMIEPAMNEVAYKRALQALDMVTIENLINRLVIIKIGSDKPESVYHKSEVSNARMSMMSNMLRRTGPSATIIWPGPDVGIEEVGAHNAILAMDERYAQAENRIRGAVGVPAALLSGESSDGKAAGWAAILGVAAELVEVQNQYKQVFKIIAERIALENGFEDVDVVWEFNQELLANKAEHIDMVEKFFKGGALSFQTTLEEIGFDFDTEQVRMQQDVDADRREELFGAPRAFTTQNNLGGDSPEGQDGRPVNPNSTDPRKDKETQTDTENK